MCVVLVLAHNYFISAPSAFPTGKYIEIDKGLTINEAGQLLKENNLIKSEFTFRLFISLFGKNNLVIAGEYKFSEPLNLYDLVKTVTDTEFKGRSVKLTFPEGLTSKEMGALIGDKFLNFTGDDFYTKARAREGYLFPDTYILPITYTVDNVITRMTDNFTAKIAPLKQEIIDSKYTLKQVVIMASILEREARTLETRKKISGILIETKDRTNFVIGIGVNVNQNFSSALNLNATSLSEYSLKE